MKLITIFTAAACLMIASSAASGTKKASKFNKVVIVVHGRTKPLEHLYANSQARRSWEEDILGDSVIPPASSVKINFDDGSDYCQLDIRGVWSDGVTALRTNVDVCATKQLVLSS